MEKDDFRKILALVVLISTYIFIVLIGLGFMTLESNLLSAIVGYVIADAKMVLSYWHGSTDNSAEKTKMIFDSKHPTGKPTS